MQPAHLIATLPLFFLSLDAHAAPACDSAAADAVLAVLAAQNTPNEVLEIQLLGDIDNERQMYRVRVDEDFLAEHYVVAKRTTCEVTGMVTDFGALPLVDDGALPPPSTGPSDECEATAVAAVSALETQNGHAANVFFTQLLDAHSDQEILRVSLTRNQLEFDSYTVLAESFGGSDCLVYGLQQRSQQVDLTSVPLPVATPKKYAASFKKAWNTYLKNGPRPEDSKISAITFFELENAHGAEAAVEAVLQTVYALGIPTDYNPQTAFSPQVEFSQFNGRALDDMFGLLRHWSTNKAQIDTIDRLEAGVRAVSPSAWLWGLDSSEFDTLHKSVVLVSSDLERAVYVDLQFLDL